MMRGMQNSRSPWISRPGIRHTARTRAPAALTAGLLAAALVAAAPPAAASAQLALEQGCLNCHGEPPRRNTPSVQQLAASFVRYRGKAGAADTLARQLRKGSAFGHIAAHERITDEQARTLMQWLIDGAP